ncbi:MAG: galactitol-1-phosphate 5-dehydrogenase [Erysipelotrichaceae bacterium]|nr:galactitol-1-phosphate 5-dehydrogenase [Erysipelotrichaceae bacterium]
MKAGVVHNKNDIRYEEVKKPVPGPKEVLIKVAFTGICGSDIPRVNGDASHFYPNIPGHEFAGTVEETGAEVQSVRPGDHVAGIPLVPCMECEQCRKGDYALCRHYSFIGSRQPGSFAQYVVVPEANALKIDQDIPFEQAAFLEPVSVAVHGLFRLDYQPGKTVAVLGGGTIGLLTAQLAEIYGAAKVVVFDLLQERLDLASRLGSLEGISTADEGWYTAAMEKNGQKGFDYVYVAAGSSETIKMAFQLAGPKAQVCMIGTPVSDVTFTPSQWEALNRKEFVLTGSWMSYSSPFPGKEWQTAADLLKSGRLRIDDSFIFKTVPLENIAHAFEMFKIPGFVKGKILIDSAADREQD